MCAKLRTMAASNNRDHNRNLSSRTLVIMFNRSHVNIGRAFMSQSLLLLLARATHMMVLLFTHIPFVVNHTINQTPPERLQQHPLLFTTNHTDCTFFVWRLNSAQPSHPGHSTILSWSEIPSGICAKLRTVAASNNRHHARNLSSRTLAIMFNCSHVNISRAFTSQSLLLLLARAKHMMVLFFTHIPFVVNHTINATPPERLQ